MNGGDDGTRTPRDGNDSECVRLEHRANVVDRRDACAARLHDFPRAICPDTEWSEIVALYDLLWRIDPSPVVELNRAVTIEMRDGPAPGLSEIEGLLAKGQLDNYPLAHSAKGELCRRAGQMDEAKASFGKALALTSQEQQRRFLQRRLAEIK
jgi:RNA polymerase sigma-70 factor (ECF subfamily)